MYRLRRAERPLTTPVATDLTCWAGYMAGGLTESLRVTRLSTSQVRDVAARPDKLAHYEALNDCPGSMRCPLPQLRS